MDNIAKHEQELTRYAMERMNAIDGMEIFGPKDAAMKDAVISFRVGDIHHLDMGTLLDRLRIAIRTSTTVPNRSWNALESTARHAHPSHSTTPVRRSTPLSQA